MGMVDIKETVKIPEGIEVHVDHYRVSVKGKKGENHREFIYPGLKIKQEEDKLVLEFKKPTKREKRMINTFKAHLRNMFKGVNEGVVYKLRICSSHFPMSVKVEGDYVSINNFLGEKVPRKAKIVQGVSVKIEGDEIILEGIDKDKVSLMAGKLEQTTRITNRSRIIFQDGCYITMKDGKQI